MGDVHRGPSNLAAPIIASLLKKYKPKPQLLDKTTLKGIAIACMDCVDSFEGSLIGHRLTQHHESRKHAYKVLLRCSGGPKPEHFHLDAVVESLIRKEIQKTYRKSRDAQDILNFLDIYNDERVTCLNCLKYFALCLSGEGKDADLRKSEAHIRSHMALRNCLLECSKESRDSDLEVVGLLLTCKFCRTWFYPFVRVQHTPQSVEASQKAHLDKCPALSERRAAAAERMRTAERAAAETEDSERKNNEGNKKRPPPTNSQNGLESVKRQRLEDQGTLPSSGFDLNSAPELRNQLLLMATPRPVAALPPIPVPPRLPTSPRQAPAAPQPAMFPRIPPNQILSPPSVPSFEDTQESQILTPTSQGLSSPISLNFEELQVLSSPAQEPHSPSSSITEGTEILFPLDEELPFHALHLAEVQALPPTDEGSLSLASLHLEEAQAIAPSLPNRGNSSDLSTSYQLRYQHPMPCTTSPQTRRSRACLNCAAKKRKCSRGSVCQSCKNIGAICEYPVASSSYPACPCRPGDGCKKCGMEELANQEPLEWHVIARKLEEEFPQDHFSIDFLRDDPPSSGTTFFICNDCDDDFNWLGPCVNGAKTHLESAQHIMQRQVTSPVMLKPLVEVAIFPTQAPSPPPSPLGTPIGSPRCDHPLPTMPESPTPIIPPHDESTFIYINDSGDETYHEEPFSCRSHRD